MVAIDEAEDAEKVKKYREKHGITYPILMDPQEAVYPRLAGRASPWNIIVDRQGVVRYSAAGFSQDAMKSVVDGLLQAPANP